MAPGSTRIPGLRRLALSFSVALAVGLVGGLPARGADEVPHYEMIFEARVIPTQRIARATWKVGVGAKALRELNLSIDPDRHFEFKGDGEVEVRGDTVMWKPPVSGGSLRYGFRIDDIRNGGGYDARITDDWALFRGDDLFPPASARTLRDAHSVSVLRLKMPRGWSVATPYPKSGPNTYEVHDPFRRFDRPTGWMVVGELGVLRETVAGTRLAIAGPVGHGVRRHDMLAFMRWHLPKLRAVVGKLPDRLLIVSAGDPMWRGGLSGPNSVFLHADRKMITSDASSPILHELFHSTARLSGGPDGDWIVEGLAEYYSLEVMARSRTLSRSRYARALERLERAGRESKLAGRNSSGAATARAVAVLHELDADIRERTEDAHSLDDVVALISGQPRTITTEGFRRFTEQATGLDLTSY
ncbi:MAG: hypothetical protein ACR2PQ_11560, partial [Myxococcota bacterium]